MTAGGASCSCEHCGAVCEGRFNACDTVWAHGPREVVRLRPTETVLGRDRRRAGAPASAGDRSAGHSAANGDAATEARAEVLEWLQNAFDGVRSDLRLVMEAVARQGAALEALADAEPVGAKVSAALEALEALPERLRPEPGADAGALSTHLASELRDLLPGYLDEAVREVVRPGQGAMLHRVDEVAAEMRRSLAELYAASAELREEIVRLSAFRSALEDRPPAQR